MSTERSLYARCQHGTFRLTADGTETTCAMCRAGDNEGVEPFVPYVVPTDLSDTEVEIWHKLEAQREAWDMHDPYPWQYEHLRTISDLREALREAMA